MSSDKPANEERADRVARALEYYKSECLGESGPAVTTCPEAVMETLTDFLTDFYHFYREEYGEPPDQIIAHAETIARMHYEAERIE